jgi:hypothetical protein
VLFFPVVVQEFLAQVPVGGVDDFHNNQMNGQYTVFIANPVHQMLQSLGQKIA